MLLTYRTCPQETFGDPNRWFRPEWFSKTACLKNAFKHFNHPEVEWIFVYDGGPSEWLDYIKTFGKEVIQLNYCENQASLIELYKIINNRINDHDSSYLLEDDFLHIDNSLNILKEGLKFTGLFSTYHHIDRFLRQDDITSEDKIWLGDYNYYRTAESTTGTMAFSKEIFCKHYQDFLHFNIEDRAFFRHLISLGTRLVMPLNTAGTHCHSMFLSKFVEWEKINRES